MFGPTKTARTPNFRTQSINVPDAYCSKCNKDVNPFWSKEWEEYHTKIGSPPYPWFMRIMYFDACTCNMSKMKVLLMWLIEKPLKLYLDIRMKLEGQR
jgi:hypothetical protein